MGETFLPQQSRRQPLGAEDSSRSSSSRAALAKCESAGDGSQRSRLSRFSADPGPNSEPGTVRASEPVDLLDPPSSRSAAPSPRLPDSAPLGSLKQRLLGPSRLGSRTGSRIHPGDMTSGETGTLSEPPLGGGGGRSSSPVPSLPSAADSMSKGRTSAPLPPLQPARGGGVGRLLGRMFGRAVSYPKEAMHVEETWHPTPGGKPTRRSEGTERLSAPAAVLGCACVLSQCTRPLLQNRPGIRPAALHLASWAGRTQPVQAAAGGRRKPACASTRAPPPMCPGTRATWATTFCASGASERSLPPCPPPAAAAAGSLSHPDCRIIGPESLQSPGADNRRRTTTGLDLVPVSSPLQRGSSHAIHHHPLMGLLHEPAPSLPVLFKEASTRPSAPGPGSLPREPEESEGASDEEPILPIRNITRKPQALQQFLAKDIGGVSRRACSINAFLMEEELSRFGRRHLGPHWRRFAPSVASFATGRLRPPPAT